MTTTKEKSFQTEEVDLSELEIILENYKGKRGAIIPVLQKVQNKYGYLPEPAVYLIAERLNISVSEILGVATFYAQFHLKPRGKHVIKVCCGTACHVKNAKRLSNKIESKLKIKVNETTEDREFTFEEVSCLGACGIAPVVTIDDHVHGEISPEKLEEVLDTYKQPAR